MNHFLKKNLLIFIRHGERSDKVPGNITTFHMHDPELTENGKRQALDIGLILSEYIREKYPTFRNFNVITSPFARTIQTAKNVLKGLSKNFDVTDNLQINYYFSEYIKEQFPTHDFPTFLVVTNEFQKLSPHLENTNLTFMNEPDNIISKQYEDDNICKERIQKGLEDLLSSIYEEAKDEHVYIIVSHGDPINFANIEFGYPGPFGWMNIKYCDSFIYEVCFLKDEFGVIKRNLNFVEQLVPEQN